ncbi:MAG: hypothetical protein HY695_31445 [Deltaproteobacteria bacterium]|nr:hypothetical protein [Deltaproteobacteria bacterium]
MSVNIRHPIAPIRQPGNSSLCWAASIAMVLGEGMTVEQVLQTARSTGRRLNQDGSMPDRSPQGAMWMAGIFHLRSDNVQDTDLTVSLLARLMRPGRIAILGGFSYPGGSDSTLHAVCAYSLVGEGAGENTRLGFVDPYTRGMSEEILNTLLDNFLTYPHYIFHR